MPDEPIPCDRLSCNSVFQCRECRTCEHCCECDLPADYEPDSGPAGPYPSEIAKVMRCK